MALEKIILKKGSSTAETYTKGAIDTLLSGKQAAGNYQPAGSYATLGSDGKVPSSQLPSYVDDVLEYTAKSAFPTTGEAGKIYIAKDTNKTYRWSGSAYVEISASLALGETSSTAYAGNKGKANADAIAALQTGKADKATTLAGYGITDAYTQSQVDSRISTCVPKIWDMANYRASYAISDGQIQISLIKQDGTGSYYIGLSDTGFVWNNQTIATVDQIPDVSNKADKATTLAGYGITDAYTKAQAADIFVHREISLSNGRYVGGYNTDVDTEDGYLILGLEDQQTPDEHHALFIGAHSVSWDGHPLATEDYVYQNYASKATTLAGYGITDAYTKTKTDNLLSNKADHTTVATSSDGKTITFTFD
jgi:hypothetical protein